MNSFLFEDIVNKKDGFLRGPFGGALKKEIFVKKSDSTYKVYEQGVVLNKDNSIGNYYITKDYYDSLMHRFTARANDILVSCSGVNYGAIYQLPDDSDTGVINQALLRIRLNNDIVDDKYFIYLFENLIVKRITGGTGDSTIPNFPPMNVVRKIPIELPSLYTQKKIAKVLSDLDAKIELNNKINTELEAMAKTLYDYWFVQFDFPFDFAQGKPKADIRPYKSSGGKMVWNEELKREIPVGWEVKELSDIANITMGQSPPGESYNENGNGTVFYQGCTDFGNRFPTIRKFTTSPTRYAKQGDILLSVRAPVGTMNIAKENCCIGRGLAALNSKDDCMSYLYEVMVNLKQIFDRRNVNGTTFGSITKDDLFSLKVISPTKEILTKYSNITNPFFEKQNILELQNKELASLRDWLLPMLMNGQVSVGGYDVEKCELGMVAEGRESYKNI